MLKRSLMLSPALLLLSACASAPGSSSSSTVSSPAAIGTPQPDAPFSSPSEISFPISLAPGQVAAGDGINWSSGALVLGDDLASAYLEFEAVRIAPGADFRLVILPSSGQALEYSAHDIRSRLLDGAFSTGNFYAGSVQVQLKNLTGADGLAFGAIAAVTTGAPALAEERCGERARIQGLWSSTEALAIERPELRRYAESVAMLTIRRATCTGFLIAPDLMMTNYHCAKISQRFNATRGTTRSCDDIDVHFDYRAIGDMRRAAGNAGEIRTRRATCREIIAWSPDRIDVGLSIDGRANGRALDYAILRLESTPLSENGAQRTPLRFARNAPAEALGFFLLSHPQNWEQHRSGPCDGTRGRDVQGFSSETFAYDCDTLQGSSGAPLLTRDYRVAGLHFGSDPDAARFDGAATLTGAFRNYATPIEEIAADDAFRQAIRARGVSLGE